MLQKKLLENGQKARQRDDHEDRAYQYRDWLRTQNISGVSQDADMIHWRYKEGELKPFAITELTRCDKEQDPGLNYCCAISNRFFIRDFQGKIVEALARELHVPAYILLFPPSVSWIWAYSFQKKYWKLYDPSTKWSEYLNTIK